MDKETARYIVKYFSHLFNAEEKLAFKHIMSEFKLSRNPNPIIEKIFRKNGWLSEDESVLTLVKDGYDCFELKAAERILTENKDKVFLNNCPKCGKLARTPQAKQCHHCYYTWHDK